MNVRRPRQDDEGPGTFTQKWGESPFARSHTQVSNLLIEYKVRLGLEIPECWIIVVISKFKFDARNPYPTQVLVGQLMGYKCEDAAGMKGPRQVRRLLESLENKGLLIRREVRGELGHYDHKEYDFRFLVAAANDCYYQDHPQERPTLRIAAAQCGFQEDEYDEFERMLRRWRTSTGHISPVDSQRTYPAKQPDVSDQTTGHATGQKSPPKRVCQKTPEKNKEKDAGVAAPSSEPERLPVDAARQFLATSDTPFARMMRERKARKA